MKDKIIEIKDLTYRYKNSQINALEDINLTINRNDIISIIGPNGGGKSTLAKIILGCLTPTKGSVVINNSSKILGYVPQFRLEYSNIDIKVKDLVLLGREALKKKFFYNKEDIKIAMDALKFVDLEEFSERYLEELSGGQKQRAYIARALACESDILILDEPTASVDPRNSQSIFYKLKELSKTKTIILITHDMSAVASLNTKIVFLNKTIRLSETKNVTNDDVKHLYHCPIELLAHGTPHRVMEFYK